ncbi:MAG: ATP-binding protein, partial [Pseudomonadota bacterium]|nr:ATP-binding protein [Pseudomonadota bacterium]
LQVLPFVVLATTASEAFADWTSFSGVAENGADSFDPVMVGAAGSVIFALIAQIGEQADFLRFLPARTAATRRSWWVAMLAGGPGWILIGIVKLLAGSFLAVLALRAGFDAVNAAQPSVMYAVAFERVVHSPTGALALMACFVVISQLKINITNAYAGSIAWSNFFSRLTHSHPGRVVWVVFNIAIALLLMELGIYQAIEHTLVIYSAVAAAWVGALVADLVVNKPLGLSPPHIEFKRAHLYDINPVGTGAMLLAVITALLAYAGAFGRVVEAFCPFIAFGTAFALAPLIAWATEGRYYLARKPRANWARQSTIGCVICENAFEPEDMAFCPAYSGAICSLCCSLDARCHDMCKPKARIHSQVVLTLRAWLPLPLHTALTGPLGRWAVMVSGLILIIAIMFGVIDGQMAATMPQGRTAFRTALLTAFAMLVPIAGVLAWLLVLGQQSRRVAQEETQRQTTLLLDEIAAHERTDAALQKAKEAAEAANLAKSRFVVGVSHELRSPLNAILGYAQLMERDSSLSPARRSNVSTMRRSGEHMAGLIEALLDIAKIEAGRIDIYRDAVRLPEFLQQLVQMFQLQAAARGIEFEFTTRGYTPDIVHTDERRLRQILINLLSNAVKFTQAGTVHLRLNWRSEVAEFTIQDTGIGIGAADIERIFEPFVRLDSPAAPSPGVGLGLTITQLLTQIMGGELTVVST